MEKTKAKEKIRYAEKLQDSFRVRYFEKLEAINGFDPYEAGRSTWCSDPNALPPLAHGDIVQYLVFGESAYTHKAFKNFKSLEAHKQFTNGWVHELQIYRPTDCDNTVVLTKVLHSQSLNAEPRHPWVILAKDGEVLTAHCDCKAGLAESCTHIAATLFKIEAVVRVRERTTVTGVPAYWVIPSGVTKVEGEVGFKIDFTSAAAKKKNLDKAINGDGNHQQGLRTCSAPSAFASRVEPPTEQDMKVFRERLSKAGDNAIALSLVPEHCNSFRDPVKPTPAPKSLKAVRNTKLDNADYSTLLEYCDKIKDCANMTPEQASKLERKTREQSKCEEWFAARAGRVTASQLHAVCHTSIESPSKTTVSSVCYPQRNCASTKPGDPRHWGITQEETARHQYTAVMAESHVGFCAEKCGLFVNPEFPYIGASPDGLVKCTCCGSGCLEVKCPFKHKLKTVRQACQEDKTFCLQFDQGKFTMKKNHRFYAQVQCQIFVTNTEFCDFVVWTEKDLCIVRVEPDPEFFSAQRERAKIFFEKVALPELVAKHFSRCHINCKPIASAHPSSKVTKSKTKPVSSGASASQQPQPRLPLCSSPGKMNTAKTKEVTQKRALSISPTKKRSPVKRGSRSLKTLWCYCRRTEEEDDMVACDNENCEVKWFHLSCVGLQCIPREDDAWFCPTCDQQTH